MTIMVVVVDIKFISSFMKICHLVQNLSEEKHEHGHTISLPLLIK